MTSGALDGRVALITGAGGRIGLGRAMALAMAQAGASIALMDVAEEDLAQTAEELRRIGGGGNVLSIVGDVSHPEDAERAVASAIQHLGALHILVNNAGITLGSSGFSSDRWPDFWTVSPAGWTRVIEVNLNGAFFMAKVAVKHMLEQRWGRIIGVTTSHHTMLRGNVTPYGPSKAGHEALVSNMAYELEGSGVTANVLVPGGAADTNLAGNAAATPAAERAKLIRPEVMGPPAVWLCSEDGGRCNAMRFIATDWDESLPIDERLAKAGAPVAWPQLGQPIPHGKPGSA